MSAWLTKHSRSQQWIAEQTGASQQSVSRWLAGGEMSLSFAVALERVTGIAVASWTQPDNATPDAAAQPDATAQS